MQEEFELFYSTALDEKDLNNLKILIGNLNLKLTKCRDLYNSNKNKYKKNKLLKEDLKKSRAQLASTKKELKDVTSTKIFKNNLKNSKLLFNNVLNSGTEDDKLKAKKEVEKATLLLKEFKFAVKENGKRADVDKINDIAISIKNLKYRYNPDFPLALNDVSFDIKSGEYVTIIGHNGSGKSTLSKILIGVYTPDEGLIKIFGNEVNSDSLDKVRKFLGIVFQNPDNQFIGSTVRSDIAFGLENKRVNPKLMEDIIVESARKVGMEKFLDKEPLNLSGGQKQRVAIASTLALNPDIIIFDEATSMLDPTGKRNIKEIMLELKHKLNKTIISITHDMDEILNADKVIVMNKGQLVKMGTPQEVLKDKEFLRSIHLNIPFVALVEEALQKEGISVDGYITLDELVDKIC